MPIDIEKDTLQTALQKLKARENTFAILEELNQLGSWEIDLYTHKSIWSKQSYINYGFEPFSVTTNLELFLSILLPEYVQKVQTALADIIKTKQVSSLRVKAKHSSGKIIDIFLRAQIVYDADNKPLKMVGTSQDITQLMQLKHKSVKDEEKLIAQSLELEYQAHHDSLTQLPNRTLFKDRLSQTAITAKRHNREFALLFIDLDQFKKINDSLGHHIGDEVLVEASERLTNCIREEDTIARLGGDEFTIILKDITSLQDVSKISQKIVDEMKKVMHIKGNDLYISASIGISLYPKDTTDCDNLIKFADTAMYKAKDEGRDNYQFYTSKMTAFAFEKVVMDTSLRIAIKEEQFVVYYQPQVDIHSGTIMGMEALVRWLHPTLGLVPPNKFIPIAEESGLIIEIDKLVRKEAMIQFTQWYKDGLNPGVLSINLAMKQLNEENFLSQLLETIQTIGFKTQWLELEITEGQIMTNPELSIQKLNIVSEMGIELAIDDFGTGYSSLSYLKKLPLNKLKIDQSFIREIPNDEEDVAITKAIIALGQSLNLKLIAEGVENEEQKEFLAQNHCDLVQGYYYSPAVSKDEMSELLKKQFS
jgi:diguanylate cyclase (GGDEF)-like protein